MENFGEQQINQHIQNHSVQLHTLQGCISNPAENMRQSLAAAAGNYKWFKSITSAELLGKNIVGPYLNSFAEEFKNVIGTLY
ncbi:hypothetical protein [Candidatus Pantoea soli]|uniref:hypothetical protein n=1 Tax=Candidatus Pantoea soli TaxID=3098669 RepID=UPI0011AA0A77|nr:hypothetical protein [Pantoea soli]